MFEQKLRVLNIFNKNNDIFSDNIVFRFLLYLPILFLLHLLTFL